MLAAIRPDSWNLPLFVHVLGATLLFGTTATVAIAGFAARARREHSELLARIVLRTFLLGVIPSWILMRAGAAWIGDKEFPDKTPGWVDVGFVVSEPGAILLIIVGILAWLAARKQGVGRAAVAVPVLASIYLVALGVAWFAMSAKPS
jgi:cytochrome bd-type quinol oxidase subunit 2